MKKNKNQLSGHFTLQETIHVVSHVIFLHSSTLSDI